MTQDNQHSKEMNAREIYGDIIDHPHWVSPTHPPMSLYDRAAQFAPFAALSGYDEMIGEESRLTDRRIELSDSDKDLLDMKLNRLMEILAEGTRPEADITYFVQDELKDGGRYDKITARIKRIDAVNREIILAPGSDPETIAIDQVYEIHSSDLDDIDNSINW